MPYSYHRRHHSGDPDKTTGETLFSVCVGDSHWAATSEVQALVETSGSVAGRTTVIVHASRSEENRLLNTGKMALYVEFSETGERITEGTRDAFANGGTINFFDGGKVYEALAFELTFTEVSDRAVRGTVVALLENKEDPSEIVILSDGEFVAGVVGDFGG